MKLLAMTLISVCMAGAMAQGLPVQNAAGEKVVALLNERASPLLPRAIRADRSPIKGVWEVYLEDGNSVFTDDLATHVIAGSVITLPVTQSDLSEREWERGAYWVVGSRLAARRAGVVLDPDLCSERCRRQVSSLLTAKETRIYIAFARSSSEGADELSCSKNHERSLKAWVLGPGSMAVAQSGAKRCAQSAAAKKIAARFDASKKPIWIHLSGVAAKEPGIEIGSEAYEREIKK